MWGQSERRVPSGGASIGHLAGSEERQCPADGCQTGASRCHHILSPPVRARTQLWQSTVGSAGRYNGRLASLF